MSTSTKRNRSFRPSHALGLIFAVVFVLYGGIFAFADTGASSDAAVSVNSAAGAENASGADLSDTEISSGTSTSAQSGTTDDMQGVSTAEVVERLRKIMEKYPSGNYFTKNGKACPSHPKSNGYRCDNCRMATADEAGTDGNYQCFGFARVVFYSVFGIPYPHLSKSVRWMVDGDEIGNVILLWENARGKTVKKSGAKDLFGKAVIGDVIQCGLTHSMVFLAATDSGILVYDANFDLTHCQILVHVISWSQIADWAGGYGMSLYRSANYLQGSDDGGTLAPFIGDMLTLAGRTSATDASESASDTLSRATLSAHDGAVSQTETAEKQIKSVSYPTKIKYLVGDSFVADGAEMVILTETGEAVTYGPDEIVFNGFDPSAPGEYIVTMEAGGMKSEPFTVTVSETVADANGDPAGADGSQPNATAIVILAAAAVAVTAVSLILRRRRY